MFARFTTSPVWATLLGVTRLNLLVRRCHNRSCTAYKKPYRPEAEGGFVLPRHEFGLDVVALIGRLRYVGRRWRLQV